MALLDTEAREGKKPADVVKDHIVRLNGASLKDLAKQLKNYLDEQERKGQEAGRQAERSSGLQRLDASLQALADQLKIYYRCLAEGLRSLDSPTRRNKLAFELLDAFQIVADLAPAGKVVASDNKKLQDLRADLIKLKVRLANTNANLDSLSNDIERKKKELDDIKQRAEKGKSSGNRARTTEQPAKQRKPGQQPKP
jgi:hypothetical protein